MKIQRFILNALLKHVLLLAGVLLFVTATAQKGDKFSSWDTDRDNRISETEFSERFEKDYAGTWHQYHRMKKNDKMMKDNKNKMKQKNKDDAFSQGNNDEGLFDDDDRDLQGSGTDDNVFSNQDDDDLFDDNRFYESSYSMWDANRDERLDEDEWNQGYEGSYGDYLENDFDAVDTNKDSYLDYDEYYNSLYETDYYSSWDTNADKKLDNKEYSKGVFDTWDVNDDNYIDENEYQTYSDRYLDSDMK